MAIPSALVRPMSQASSAVMRTPTRNFSPTAARIAARTWSEKRVRPARSPP